MMRLPALPWQQQRSRREMVALRGVNYSDNHRDGDLAECKNLSARRYPYIAARKARVKQEGYAGVTAITAWGKLVAVQGTRLLCDGTVVGSVRAGEKQFAVVNTKMVIWPDQVYLDVESLSVKPLGAAVSGTGAVFTENTMTVDGWTDLTGLFKAGDCVTISGCTAAANNKDIVVKGVTATVLTVGDKGFSPGMEPGTVTVRRRVPELDFICESENRLWGASNTTKTIYASALGDPTNFFVYEGLSTDSYALAVGSEGEFTGCCKLSSAVLFWKENCLHKLLGSYPAEYALYTYHIDGLQRGSHKSLQAINEVLYYLGVHGVYAYSGGTPSLVSACFGERRFTNGVAGTDGERYYLSALEGEQSSLMVLDTGTGLWLREDETRCVDFTRMGRELYFADSAGGLWLANGEQEDGALEWTAQFTPFYETVQGRKGYSRLLLRLEMPRGAWMQAQVRCDGGRWHSCGQVSGGSADVVSLRITPNRCDKFEIRLSGKGPCAILSVLREFCVGSHR